MTTLTLPAIEIPSTTAETPAGEIRTASVSLPERKIEVDGEAVADLMAAARRAAEVAYAPFSKFHVGAALVMADDPGGDIITGCNVENSSYGATVCAERVAVFTAAARGLRRLRWLAVSTLATLDAPLQDRSPCGVCRQVIREFADEDTLVLCDSGEDGVIGEVFDIDRLLPFGFRFAPVS